MLSCSTTVGIEKLLALRCMILVYLLLLSSQAIYPGRDIAVEARYAGESSSSINNQATINDLKPGEPLSRDIGAGKTDSFRISISAKRYFLITIEQQGVALKAELFRADGKSVAQIESVNGAHGPLYLCEIASDATDYKLDVSSTESWAAGGRYEVKLEIVRDVETTDESRISAQQAFSEGQSLLSQAQKQSGEDANKSRNTAIEKFTAAAQQWHELTDYHGEVISLYMIGATYQRSLGKSSEAKQFLLQALSLAPKLPPNDWRLEASLWNDLGVVYDSLYDEKNAHTALENALRIFETHQDQRGVASANNNFGLAYARSGQAREAIKAFQIALPIRQADHDKSNEFITLNNLGGAYETLGEPRQALEYYTQALNGWKELHEDSRIPIGLNNIARASDTLGLWQTALIYYQQALELAQKQSSRRVQATLLYNIGDLYSRLNDPTRALNNYQAALRIQQELKNPRDEANVLAHIAQIHLTLDQTDQALENYNRAMQILAGSAENVESRRVQAYTLIGIAGVYLNSDPAKALDYCERARKLSQEAGDLQQEADALEKMGQSLKALGQQAKAVDSYNNALRLRRELQNRVGEASTLFQIATLKSELGQLSDAAKDSEELLRIVESLRSNLLSRQLRTTYLEKTQNYYELLIDLKMRLYKVNHNEDDRAAALAASERKRARGLIDSLTEANANIRQGISPVLVDQLQQNEEKLGIKARLKEQLLNEIKVNEKLLEQSHTNQQSRRVNELKQKLTNVSKDILELSHQDDEIETRIKLSNPRFVALSQPATLNSKDVQNLLSNDTILLQYSLGENRSYVWVVKSSEIQSFELAGRATIEGAVRKLLSALTARGESAGNESEAQKEIRIRNSDEAYTQASSELGKVILEPIASVLDQKRVIVVADGALQLVPFTVLPDPNNSVSIGNKQQTSASTLINRYEIVTLPSASVLALQRKEFANRKPAPLSLAVVADPVFDSNDERIAQSITKGKRSKGQVTKAPSSGPDQPVSVTPPSSNSKNDVATFHSALRDVGLDPNALGRLMMSHSEAAEISSIVPAGRSFTALGFDASRATVMSGKLANYSYVHFATHGVLDLEHPDLSGMVLSRFDKKGQPIDGYLRLYEIYNLNLPAELVVLSACQTGTGKQVRGEGLMALTRGFMYAGAARVVATLWKVDDAATAELMVRFYKEMFTNGKRPAAALRDAQISLSKERRWSSPFYWAGFVLQGEWR